MAAGNKLRFIRAVLYRLKRDYGTQADLYHQLSESVDLTTGKQTVVKDKVIVKRAILLPARTVSAFAYDLSFIAANKNFTYGGIFGNKLREVLIDKRDIGDFTFEDDKNTYVIIRGVRYEITQFTELEYKAGYYLVLKATEGAQLAQFVESKVKDELSATQSVEGTIE